MTKRLDKPTRSAARGRTKGSPKGLGWTPERRAKQAELVRSGQPWTKSTGPKTKPGKTRSAANAKKHGFRGRPFIERVREERQLIRDAAATIALARDFLRVAARSVSTTQITVWTGDPDVDGGSDQPHPPVKPL